MKVRYEIDSGDVQEAVLTMLKARGLLIGTDPELTFFDDDESTVEFAGCFIESELPPGFGPVTATPKETTP